VWTRLDDGSYQCADHGETFGATGTCPHPDHAVASHAELDVDAPSDPQVAIDEAWCRAQRDAVVELAKQMADERDERGAIDRAGYSTVAKLYDTALKFHRAAVEERHRRGDKEHDIWLVNEHRRLKERSH
jgi:hypothetical protein